MRRVDGIADLVQAVVDAEPSEVHETLARDVQIAGQSPGGIPRTLAALEPNRGAHGHDDLVRGQQRGDPLVGFDGHDATLAQAVPRHVRGGLVEGRFALDRRCLAPGTRRFGVRGGPSAATPLRPLIHDSRMRRDGKARNREASLPVTDLRPPYPLAYGRRNP